MWEPFLARTGGIAPDMPGFGRTTKRADLPYDVPFQAARLDAFLAWRGIGRVRLVAHDWGIAWALAWARLDPGRVDRLVLLDDAPRTSRLWRTPVAGELAMGLPPRLVLRRVLPRAAAARAREDFDLGTQRATLRVHRSVTEEEVATQGVLSVPALEVPGRWSWLEQPEIVDRVVTFLDR